MLKLRQSVSVVDLGNNVLELFKTNTRKSVCIKTGDHTIEKVILSMDGSTPAKQLGHAYGIDSESPAFQHLVAYLKKKAILANDALVVSRPDYSKYRRVIHFIEDYSESDEMLLEMWENIRNSTVAVIGMGAVGTWVAATLVQSGVKSLILIDNDRVELSNLHRQFGYSEKDIGRMKTSVLSERLHQIEPELKVREVNKFLDGEMLDSQVKEHVDLVINCADQPTVDQTSEWVGSYCMKHGIPHIVGGGYNLHLSLVGPTIIPNKTACYKCFDIQLQKINDIGTNIKRLHTRNRKIGSFGPMCTLIASFVGMEAVKILTRHIEPDNVNRRGEFNIYDKIGRAHV